MLTFLTENGVVPHLSDSVNVMAEQSFSSELIRTINLHVEARRNTWGALIKNGSFGCVYPYFLVQTFHYVKFSCPLMRLALSALPLRYIHVRTYLERHVDEEQGHEQWLLEDLQRLGYDERVVERILPLRSTAALAGTQFYLISALHPVALLGYIYVLESDPPSQAVLAEISSSCGVPMNAMSTLLRHGVDDISHTQDLLRILDGQILSEQDRRMVLYSAVLTAAHLHDMSRDVALAVGRSPELKGGIEVADKL